MLCFSCHDLKFFQVCQAASCLCNIGSWYFLLLTNPSMTWFISIYGLKCQKNDSVMKSYMANSTSTNHIVSHISLEKVDIWQGWAMFDLGIMVLQYLYRMIRLILLSENVFLSSSRCSFIHSPNFYGASNTFQTVF